MEFSFLMRAATMLGILIPSRLRGWGFTKILIMGIIMKENGKRICRMEKEWKNIPTTINMKEGLCLEANLGSGSTNSQMGESMKVLFITGTLMVKEK